MKTAIECIPCLIKQAVDSAMLVTDDERAIGNILKMVFAEFSKIDLSLTPPEIASIVQSIIRNELKNSDPYLLIKEKSTKKAFELAPEAEKAIYDSEDPFSTSIAFAIAGNILDFAKNISWDEELISNTFSVALDKASKFDKKKVNSLFNELSNASIVLMLGDNAGEAVFDNILIKNLPGAAKVYYAVKSSPVINDVTMKEALQSGIDKNAVIIENGADIPGTVLETCSPEFIDIFHRADVVLSKGQGNYETLNSEKRKIWFLFQVKCPVIGGHCGFDKGSWIILEKPSIY